MEIRRTTTAPVEVVVRIDAWRAVEVYADERTALAAYDELMRAYRYVPGAVLMVFDNAHERLLRYHLAPYARVPNA